MSAFERWWHAPAPARRLAMLRILVGGYALAYLLVRFGHLVGVSGMSAKQWKPIQTTELGQTILLSQFHACPSKMRAPV